MVTVVRGRIVGGVLAVFLVWLSGCSVDADANPAHGCDGCPRGQCHQGFCLLDGDAGRDAGGSPDAGPVPDVLTHFNQLQAALTDVQNLLQRNIETLEAAFDNYR